MNLSDPHSGRETLIRGMSEARTRISSLRERARSYYLEVMLLGCACPHCHATVWPAQAGLGHCQRGHELDLTQTFQVSRCCGAKIRKRVMHYACVRCGHTVASRFLFDERIFDAAYFAACARESRERKQQKVEEIRRLLAGTRSLGLSLAEVPELDAVPGLAMDLNRFVHGVDAVDMGQFLSNDVYDMRIYWDSIVSFLQGGEVLFSNIPPIHENAHVDRVRCFRTLVQMWHEREVRLTQYGNDLLVEAL